MLEMDDSEHYNSPLSDDTLRIVALFIDRAAYDQMLYRGDYYYRLSRVAPSNAGIGPFLGERHSHNSSVHQDQGWSPQKKAE